MIDPAAGQLDLLDQIENLLSAAVADLPPGADESREHIWDARTIVSYVKVMVDRRRKTGEFAKIDR